MSHSFRRPATWRLVNSSTFTGFRIRRIRQVSQASGYLVVRTGIPSFLVTLGTFLILQGVNLAVTKIVTGNVATPSVAQIGGFQSARAPCAVGRFRSIAAA
jgi:ribose/xylose/arabinose/galactoside ABC-type transport system permease subunit